MSKRTPLQAASLAIVRALAGHSWSILSLSHCGVGLANISPQLLIGLMAAAAVLATTTSWITPMPGAAHSAAFVGLSVAAFLMLILAFAGRVAAAGMAILHVLTEPVLLVVRMLPGGQTADHLLSIWVFGASLVFIFRVWGHCPRAAK